jgi:hypothetical protein
MSASQELLVVFFAIFWGTAANAWPRWKPFSWGSIGPSRVNARLAWSFLMLNFVPVLFFGCALLRLDGKAQAPVDWCSILSGIVPAFAIFGIYRIWLAGLRPGHDGSITRP